MLHPNMAMKFEKTFIIKKWTQKNVEKNDLSTLAIRLG